MKNLKIREILEENYKAKGAGLVKFLNQDIMDRKLKQDLEKLPHPAVKLCLTYLTQFVKVKINYETVSDFYEQLNIITMKDFIKFNNSISDFNIINLFTNLKSELSLGIVSSVSQQVVRDAIKKIDSKYIEPHCSILFSDVYYRICDHNRIKDITDASKLEKIQYVAERFDCDDFARALKCFLAQQHYGNLALAYCEINLYSKDYEKSIGAHALNLIVSENHEGYQINLIEPQTDKILNIGDPVINTKYYKIRFLSF